MSYIALYRKWRPKDFDEVKGQDAIVQTLQNQIIYQRIGHAYLFCGTRGTGKTSIAKLFAKAVNCEHPVNGNPCNACTACEAINHQTNVDVIEIDAASNNGVENIREIREQVQYPPATGRYKVYIIDEVHMLSTGAFNALLKTLEEPPSYVIFILATTEKHKIPITILSRCQKYDFKRISIDTITQHLTELMEREEIPVEPKALSYIARAADGSMRDALSLLDQCIAFYLGQTLTFEKVLNVLGTVDTTVFQSLLQHILAQDTGGVLDIIEDIIQEGRELSQFLSDFLWYLRNLLLIKDQSGTEDSLNMSADSIEEMKKAASSIEASSILRFIRILSDLSNQLRGATQKRILMEVGFIKLCSPQMEEDTNSLLERIRQLEKYVQEGAVISSGQTGQTVPTTDIPEAPVTTQQISSEDTFADLEKRFSPAELKDLQHITESWNSFIHKLPDELSSLAEKGNPHVSKDSAELYLVYSRRDNPIIISWLQRDHSKKLHEIEEFLSQMINKKITLKCIFDDDKQAIPRDFSCLSKVNFPDIERL